MIELRRETRISPANLSECESRQHVKRGCWVDDSLQGQAVGVRQGRREGGQSSASTAKTLLLQLRGQGKKRFAYGKTRRRKIWDARFARGWIWSGQRRGQPPHHTASKRCIRASWGGEGARRLLIRGCPPQISGREGTAIPRSGATLAAD
jgi:hypothetical protein